MNAIHQIGLRLNKSNALLYSRRHDKKSRQYEFP